MTKKLTQVQQDELVIEITTSLDSMDYEEIEPLLEDLDVEHRLQVSDAIREFADNAIGSERTPTTS